MLIFGHSQHAHVYIQVTMVNIDLFGSVSTPIILRSEVKLFCEILTTKVQLIKNSQFIQRVSEHLVRQFKYLE